MPLEPLSYDANLTLEQAEHRFQEALEEFNSVKSDYTGGFFNWQEYKFLMSKRNRERLTKIAGVTLTLRSQQSVREQAKQVPYEQTLIYKSGVLMEYAMDMMSSFANTSTKRIGYSKPIWRDALPFESA